ncbi:DMT family transporter [Tolumonas lignilytica]|jgi:Predicted permease, DMT superfamily|uniref:DMT family transporter n=1 Tax=Tolumonas lignilytica TaxID=1283284 RepID=UPI000463F6D4|nr:EamA family transporter [Tolumonas lignilytica]
MPPFLVALTPILWGTTYLITGKYLADWPALWLAVMRAIPPGLLLLAIRPAKVAWRQVPFLLLISFLYIGAFFPLLFLSALHLPGSVAGTLSATLPLMLLGLQWLFLHKVPSRQALLCALLGLAGIILLLGPGVALDWIGVTAALTSVLLIGICSLLLQQHPWQGGLISFTGWQLLLGGLMILPLAYWQDGAMPMPVGDNWFGLLWLILLNSALAYVLWLWGMVNLPLNRLGLLTLLNPITAVLAGSVLMHETLSVWQWCGVVTVLTSLVLELLFRPKRPSAVAKSA